MIAKIFDFFGLKEKETKRVLALLPSLLQSSLEGRSNRVIRQVAYNYLVLHDPEDQLNLLNFLKSNGTIENWYKTSSSGGPSASPCSEVEGS